MCYINTIHQPILLLSVYFAYLNFLVSLTVNNLKFVCTIKFDQISIIYFVCRVISSGFIQARNEIKSRI